jgi:hypothetical protein
MRSLIIEINAIVLRRSATDFVGELFEQWDGKA